MHVLGNGKKAKKAQERCRQSLVCVGILIEQITSSLIRIQNDFKCYKSDISSVTDTDHWPFCCIMNADLGELTVNQATAWSYTGYSWCGDVGKLTIRQAEYQQHTDVWQAPGRLLFQVCFDAEIW